MYLKFDHMHINSIKENLFALGLLHLAKYWGVSKSKNTQTVPSVSPNILIPWQFRGHCKLNTGKSEAYFLFRINHNSKPLQRDR